MYSLLLLLYIVNAVNCHGYLSWPAARQYKCYRDNNFWWPETGENIPDDACREAYQTVYAKYRNVGESHGLAANAAQYMFQQYYEYAAIAGPNYEDLEHVKENVVSSNLCAAGAHDRTHNFGDKSNIIQQLKCSRFVYTLYVAGLVRILCNIILKHNCV